MGMNYYLRSLPCKECGHCKIEQHIGKSSIGWEFHFRGYRCDDIMSYEDWLREFANPNREIYDEDNIKIEVDEFKDIVQHKKGGLNHYNIVTNQPETEKEKIYLSEYGRHRYYPASDDDTRNCWKDDAGYAFTDWKFS